MEAPSSTSKLCLHLISSAFQRCRVSELLCRLSVVLKSSPASFPPLVRVSISDTGIGSSLEEFRDLKFSRESIIDTGKWDGLLSVKTTRSFDTEVHQYILNFGELSSNRRLTKLPSLPKNGVKFSGTEVCLSISACIDALEMEIKEFFRKMLVLRILNVTIELVVERDDIPGLRQENLFISSEKNSSIFPASDVERLIAGLEEYVLTHGNRLNRKCDSCFPTRKHLKVGSGTACSIESHRNHGRVMDVVIIIHELESTCPLFHEFNSKTKVLFFKDFDQSSMSQSSLNALTNFDWKSYGLTLGKVVDEDGYWIEWQHLPPQVHIYMVLHCYNKQVTIPSDRHKTQNVGHLLKRGVKLALDDLKENHAGALLSQHALKICSHAPDLARSITGLILGSADSDFQRECLSLLGLQSGEIDKEAVEDCIQEKIISVIQNNDMKSQKSKEVDAPFLFEDECPQDSSFNNSGSGENEDDNEYEFSYLE